MGYATLGYPKGDGIRFRIDPDEVSWNFKINTNVTPTIGGRVIQVVGATLSDMVVRGSFGENRGLGNASPEHPGTSWKLAVSFSREVQRLMKMQSTQPGGRDTSRVMTPPMIFSYPPLNWKFRVFIKNYADPDGGTLTFRPGKFSHGYQMTLFIVQDESDRLIKAGSENGVINKAKAKAINDYIGRISDGIGWKPSIYNGPTTNYTFGGAFPNIDSAPVAPLSETTDRLREEIAQAGG